MVTSYEVEFGKEIGSGGLYVFFRSCGHSVSAHCIFRQWTSISRELEQDEGGTQGAHGGRWGHA